MVKKFDEFIGKHIGGRKFGEFSPFSKRCGSFTTYNSCYKTLNVNDAQVCDLMKIDLYSFSYSYTQGTQQVHIMRCGYNVEIDCEQVKCYTCMHERGCDYVYEGFVNELQNS